MKANVRINENCKLAADWDAEKPDENVEHYKAKLRELYDKFSPWIELEKPSEQKVTLSTGPAQFSLFVPESG